MERAITMRPGERERKMVPNGSRRFEMQSIKKRLEVQQSSAMSKDTRSDEVVRDHGIRRHWSEKPVGVLEGASPEQT